MTLDDSGFTTKVADANGKITALNRTFNNAGKAADAMERSLSKIGDATKGTAKAVSGVSKTFDGVKASMSKLGETARGMRKDLDSIGRNTEAVTGKFRSLSSSAGTLSKNFSGIASNTSSLSTSLDRMSSTMARAVKFVRHVGAQAKETAADIDKLKQGVGKLATSTGAIEAEAARAARAMASFASQLQRLNSVSSQVTLSQGKVANAIEHTGGSFHSWVFSLGMAREAAFALYDVFLRAPVAVIQTNAELERMQKLFEGMSNKPTTAERAAEGKQMTDSMIDLAMNAPFDVKTLADAAVKLKSGGIDPLNGSLKTLADGIAHFGGNSNVFHRAAVAIQQMAGKGVISMEELRQQLGEAMPNAMNMMAASMGLTVAELSNLVSKGVVEAKSALARMMAQMELEMGGSAESMMKTWTGMWEGFKTRMIIFSSQIGEAGFFQQARTELSLLLEAMDEGRVKGFADAIGAGLTKVMAELRDVLVTAQPLFTAMGNTMQNIAPAVGALWEVFKGFVGTLAAVESSTGLITAAMTAYIAVAAVGKIASIVGGFEMLSGVTQAYSTRLAAMTRLQQMQNATMAAGTVQMGALGRTMQMTSAHTMAAVGAVGAMRGALWTLVVAGGPIMALTALLAAAIGWWMEWARKGEEAVSRVRAAASGNAPGWANGDQWKKDHDDLLSASGKTLKAKKNYEKYQAEYDQALISAPNDANRLAVKKSLMDRARKDYDEATAYQANLKKAYEANRKKHFDDKAKDEQSRIQVKYDDGNRDFRARISDELSKFRESEKYQKMSPEQRQKGEVEIAQRRAKAYIAALQKIHDTTKSQAEKLVVEGKIRETNETIGNHERLVSMPIKLTQDKKAGDGSKATIQDDSSPLTKMIGKINADAATAAAGYKLAAESIRGVLAIRREAEGEALKAFMSGELDKEIAQRNGKKKVEKLDDKDREAAFKSFGDDLTQAIEKQKLAEAQLKAIEKAQDDLDKSTIALTESKESLGMQLESAPITKYRLAMEDVASQVGLSGDRLEEFNAIWQKTMSNNANALIIKQTRELKQEIRSLSDEAQKIGERARDRAQADAARAYSARERELSRQRREAELQARAAAGDVGAGAELQQLQIEQARERTEERRLEMQERRNREREREIELDRRIAQINKSREEHDARVAAARANGGDPAEIAELDRIGREKIDREGGQFDHFETLMDRWANSSSRMGMVWSDAVEGMKATTADFLDDAVNGLTDFAMGGSLSFSQMRDSAIKSFGDIAGSVIKDSIKMSMQLLVQKAIMASMGWVSENVSMPNLLPANAFAKGGVFSGSGVEVYPFAKGGAFTNQIVSAPTMAPMALFGEDGSEAIMPLARDSSGSLGVRIVGGAGAAKPHGGLNVEINMINQSGQQLEAESGTPRFDGERMILDVVVNAVSRPGQFRETMRGAMR